MFRCYEFISHSYPSKLDCMRELTSELNQLGSNVNIIDIHKEFEDVSGKDSYYGNFILKATIIYEE